jgi:general secretion pathway protein F
MSLFRYIVLKENGQKIKGVINADSLLQAKERLRYQYSIILELKPTDNSTKEPTLSSSQLLDFTRMLSQLLKAGLPLYESLLSLEEKYKGHKMHSLFLDLCDRLKGGMPLSEALSRYPKTFSGIYICMVKVAEQSGSLSSIFDKLASLLERQNRLKKQLLSAIAYPAFLGCFCLVIMVVLLVFVVPSMAELFEGRSLHPLTQTVLKLSQLTLSYGWWMLALIALFSTLFIGLIRSQKYASILSYLTLKTPLIKTLVLQAALIRFCRALSILLEGGVPLLEALTLSREVMHNRALDRVVKLAAQRVAEGGSLSHELKKSPLIPSLMIRLLAISEETGDLAHMMQRLSMIFEEELEKNLTHLTTLLQPLLLLILGLIVGVILLSVLIPLTDVSSIIET